MAIFLRHIFVLGIALAYFVVHPVFAGDGIDRVLFVGNSITYTNNLPAIFGSFSRGRIYVDMFVKSGGRLADLLKDPRLLDGIRHGNYKAVILQEQGGLVLCSTVSEFRSTQQCRDSRTSTLQLANLVKASGADVFYLGTYQTDPATSRSLVRREAQVSKKLGAHYVEISDTLLALRRKSPSLAWYYPNDLHPGPMLTTLMAVKIYKTMYGKPPPSQDICTTSPLFRPKDHLDGMINQGASEVKSSAPNCVASALNVQWMINEVK